MPSLPTDVLVGQCQTCLAVYKGYALQSRVRRPIPTELLACWHDAFMEFELQLLHYRFVSIAVHIQLSAAEFHCHKLAQDGSRAQGQRKAGNWEGKVNPWGP
jgi:hypothetical protein